jgi:multiple sugar transport system permease protein
MNAKKVTSHVILLSIAVATLLPLFWMLATSIKPPQTLFEYPPRWIPVTEKSFAEVDGERREVRALRSKPGGLVRTKVLTVRDANGEIILPGQILDLGVQQIQTESQVSVRFENYPEAWEAYPFVSFARAYANSLIVALIVTLGQVLTCVLAAYAFARLNFVGRDLIFFGYLATMMIPGAVTMNATFVLLKNLPIFLNSIFGTQYFSRELIFGGRVIGVDSYFALIVPRFFSAYGTFMLRQFFMGIPKELEDAARMDGCGSWGLLRHVIIPLSKPALATLAIFTFMWTWGDFMWPLFVTSSPELYTLPVLLQSFQGQYGTQMHLLMAASVTALVPIVIVFLLGQRYFIEGIQLGGVKG